MVVHLFRQQGGAGHEGEGGVEVSEGEAAVDGVAAGHLCPGGQACQGFRAGAACDPLSHADLLNAGVFMTLSPSRAHNVAPSLADIEALADQALGAIPPDLRAMAAGVIIRVEDFPDAATCADMDLDSPYELLGLYRGTSLTQKSVGDVATDVDMVFLYRRPILDEWCETGERLGDLVRTVLIHEIGHHFGLSDAQMEALEAAADEGVDEGGDEGTGDGG